MVSPYHESVVQICKKLGDNDFSILGTGFIVGDGTLVATCAHVLESSCCDAAAGKQPLYKVTGTEQACGAIIADYWVGVLTDGEEYSYEIARRLRLTPFACYADVALLRLTQKARHRPLPLSMPEEVAKGWLESYGFPRHEDHGLHAKIEAIGVLHGPKPQMQVESKYLSPGYSGAPIWHAGLEAAIGIATEVKESGRGNALRDVAFMVPAEAVVATFPAELKLCENTEPFVGFKPFDSDKAKFFFGRRDDANRIANIIRNSDSRWLLLRAPSGSGKSSLIRAGVHPLLEADSNTAIKPILLFPNDGRLPSQTISTVLEDGQRLGMPEGSLRSPRILLSIDQAEDLLERADRVAYIQDIYQLMCERRDLCCLFIVREDLVGSLAPDLDPICREFPGKKIDIGLKLSSVQFIEMIEQPALKAGWPWPTGFVALMRVVAMSYQTRLNSATEGEATVLPLLQFTLSEIWRRRRSGTDPTVIYEELGGLAGSVTASTTDYFRNLTDSRQKALSAILVDLVHLTFIGTAEPIALRRPRAKSELSAIRDPDTKVDALAVVDSLIDYHILASSVDERGDPVVEIVHDVLLKSWPLLAEWIGKAREQILQRQQIEDARQRWTRSSKLDADLLSGDVLSNAAKLSSAFPYWLSNPQREYVSASVAADKERNHRRDRRIKKAGVAAGISLFVLYLGSAVGAYFAPWAIHPWPGVQMVSTSLDSFGFNLGSTDNIRNVAIRLRDELSYALVGEGLLAAKKNKCTETPWKFPDLNGNCSYSVWDTSQAVFGLAVTPTTNSAVLAQVGLKNLFAATDRSKNKLIVLDGRPAGWPTSRDFGTPKSTALPELSGQLASGYSRDAINKLVQLKAVASVGGGVLTPFADAEPAMWSAAAFAAVLAFHCSDVADNKLEVRKRLRFSLYLMDRFRSRAEGKYNAVIDEVGPEKNLAFSQYASTTALLAEIMTLSTGPENADYTSSASAAEAIARKFEQDTRPSGYWPDVVSPGVDDPGKSPEALSFQIAAELLLTEQVLSGSYTIKKSTEQVIETLLEHANSYAVAPWPWPRADFGKYDGHITQPHYMLVRASRTVTYNVTQNEDIDFSWYPWAVATAALWYHRLPDDTPPAARDHALHLLNRLVVQLGDDAVQGALKSRSYQKAELLFGMVLASRFGVIPEYQCAADSTKVRSL